MKKFVFLRLLCLLIIGIMVSCKDNNEVKFESFDPTKPIQVTSFYPDSGGIATPMIIEGAISDQIQWV